jgi:signal transduction histidine kinase
MSKNMESSFDFQQSIIDGLAEPIMVIGLDYQVILMNQAAHKFATKGGEPSNQTFCYQISHHRDKPCDGKQHPCPIQEVRSTGKPITVLHEHYRARSEKRLVEVTASPLWGSDGTFMGIIELMHDVTDRKKAEKALKNSADRLRALTTQLAEVEDAERQRLAQELHDQVGQNLTTLGINLNIIKSQIPADTLDLLQSRLDDSLRLVEQTTERIRGVMSDLRPPVLDDYGLLAALRWYVQHFAWRTEIDVSVIGEEPVPRFPKRVEIALFKITQEALTNIAKHSQASEVIVRLNMIGNTLRLTISDNGKGFNMRQINSNEGWGLLIINQRAEAIGGRSRIESNLKKGTHVIVEVDR